MGYLISVWSPYHQQSTTASMAAIACRMAQGDETVCVTHSQFARSDLEGIFKGRFRDETTDKLYSSKGLAGLLLKYRMTPILLKDDVLNCAFEKDLNQVRLLSGIHHEYPLHNDEQALYQMLIGPVKDSFDYTFVDVAGGMDNSLSKNLLRASDLVIVVLSQAENVISYFSDNGLPRIDVARGDSDYEDSDSDIKKRVPPYKVLIGSYLSHARSLKAKNIEARYGFLPLTVPMSIDYMNALNEGHVSSFFVTNEKLLKKRDDTFEFMKSVQDDVNAIRSFLKGEKK